MATRTKVGGIQLEVAVTNFKELSRHCFGNTRNTNRELSRVSVSQPGFKQDDFDYTVRSVSRCALRLRYVDFVVSIEVAAEVCCCFTVFSH
jgi:hypothetical protein